MENDSLHARFYNENVYEDKEAVYTICATAANIINDNFKVDVREDPRIAGVVFATAFHAILDQLESLEKEYSDFEINFASRFSVGYTTNSDDEDEKQGNFMVFIKHRGLGKKNIESDEIDMKARDKAVQWNTQNITSQADIIRNISIKAAKDLKEIGLTLATSELINPFVATVYESIINYLKINRRQKDEFEYEINFMSCFFIKAVESEDGEDIISIRPNIESKLKLKNDSIATAKFE